MTVITKTQLENASLDATSLELFVNADKTVTITTRTGATYPSLSKFLENFTVADKTFLKTGSDPDGTIAGIAGTVNNEVFRVPQGEGADESFKYYINQSGTAVAIADALGVGQIDDIKSMIFIQTDANTLMKTNDTDGKIIYAFGSDGSFFIPGIYGALQDLYTIKNSNSVRLAIGQIADILQLMTKTSDSYLSALKDVNGVQAVTVAPDGGIFVTGILGALQDLYPIKNAGKVAAAVAKTAEIDGFSNVAHERMFYALDKTGALVNQGVRVSRVTRRSKTGYNLNSWPQGKLCISSTGKLYCGFNMAASHGGSNTKPAFISSSDGGLTWSEPLIVVNNENFARGTDWWALGVDDTDKIYGIVRSRGANNQVGVTFYNLYTSVDDGATWTKVGVIDEITQNIAGVDYVPELFHDMCFVAASGKMITAYHFANSSRLGFMTFSVSDPLNTVSSVDVIAHGEMSTTTYVEATIAIEYDRVGTGTVYGGLRTQSASSSYPSQLYYMNPDLTGFTRFNAPESVQYSPMAIRRVNGQFVLLTIERYNTGTMNLWFGTPTDFYSQNSANFYKMQIGKILNEPITSGATNVGVQDMEVFNNKLYFAWSTEVDHTYSDTYLGVMDMYNPTSLINSNYLEGIK